jgi:hypothetical protein
MSGKTCASGQVELDFDRLGRIGNKINELLSRKTKGNVESYAVLRFLCVWYEEDLGIKFEPEFEEELSRVVHKSLDGVQAEPSESES